MLLDIILTTIFALIVSVICGLAKLPIQLPIIFSILTAIAYFTGKHRAV